MCAAAESDPTTAVVVQHFAESEYAGVMAEILAAAADQALSPEQVETQVLAAAARWQHADDQRALQSLLRQPLEALTAHEREALTRGLIATADGNVTTYQLTLATAHSPTADALSKLPGVARIIPPLPIFGMPSM